MSLWDPADVYPTQSPSCPRRSQDRPALWLHYDAHPRFGSRSLVSISLDFLARSHPFRQALLIFARHPFTASVSPPTPSFVGSACPYLALEYPG